MSDKTQLVEVPTNPMTLLQQAVQSGMDPEQLKTLVELQERWEARESEKAFAKAMHEAQQDMPVVVKDGVNTHSKARYALLQTVQKECKPIYDRHGFALSFGEDDCPLDRHKRTICDVTHSAGYCRRYHIDLPVDSSGSMNAVQGNISTTSYAQRRLLCMIFNVTIAGEDDDGMIGSCITAEELAVLESLIKETSTDLPTFLQWKGVDSLEQFPRGKFKEAKALLEKKRGHASL